MTCEECRELLAGYYAHALTGEVFGEVLNHLQACPACHGEAEALRAEIKAELPCEECREQLPAFIKQELDEERTAKLQRHLNACQECTREHNETAKVLAVLDRASADPIVRIATTIVERAVAERASDIHIRHVDDHCRTYYRVDGVLREAIRTPDYVHEPLVDRFKAMAGLNVSERSVPQDGRLLVKLEGKELDLRVSALPSIAGESIVVRLLDRSQVRLSLDDICLRGAQREQVMGLLRRPTGLFIVTGPTGSGKTTTLYALLNALNHEGIHLMSIEDPVEYRLDDVTQVAVNRRVGLDYKTALRHCLRQDPDVIMCSELRDEETVELAIQAALTGHMVLSVLHTDDAVMALRRLLDLGAERFLLASTLVGATAQRLLRRLCPACREAAPPDETECCWLRSVGVTAAPAQVWHSRGCEECRHTGYRGRLAVYEVLEIDQELRDMLARGDDLREVERLAAGKLRPLAQAAADYVLSGETSMQEAARATSYLPRHE